MLDLTLLQMICEQAVIDESSEGKGVCCLRRHRECVCMKNYRADSYTPVDKMRTCPDNEYNEYQE
ncbi:MAG: hypothetical protein KKA64_01615 [Nanoarchaeota archaeon]|nr:hypothetical protein [Nanoarchaeota archaeon]